MKFLKENSYDIVRLYITQIGISIFSLILYLAAAAIDESVTTTLQIIISVFAMMFYFVLLYTSAWDWGAKDKIRIDGGRMAPHKTRALKMSLIANIPNFILAIMTVVCFGVCLLGNEAGFGAVGVITNTGLSLSAAMYQGILHNVFAFLRPDGPGTHIFFFAEGIGYLVAALLSVLVTHFGYYIGTKDKRIFSFIKNKQKYE